MKYNEYLKLVAHEMTNNRHTRAGQAYWNIFEKNKNKIFKNDEEAKIFMDKIRGTVLDPFHRDDLIPYFLVAIGMLFEDEKKYESRIKAS